jgi:hypothetical protein
MNDPVNDGNPDRRGLRTAIGLACRRFLREEPDTADHPRDCEACRNHLLARERLAGLLRQRPESPQELRSPELLPAIFERVVTGAEAGATGALLRQGLSVQPVANDLEGNFGLLESSLARALFRRPMPPSADAWESVQEAILSGQRMTPASVGANHRRWLGAAAVAAAAIVCGMMISDGTRTSPTIVFTDVASMPDVDFVVLRDGIPR